MAGNQTGVTKIRRRPSWLRWLPVIVLGVVVGLLAVLFMRTIYNPFAATVPDPLVLVPGDADFVLSIPDFPKSVAEIRDRRLIQVLGKHAGFGRFLETPTARETGVVDALRDALLQIDMLRHQLPLGLDVLGDVSGQHVLVAGYVPEKGAGGVVAAPGGDLRFMALFKPRSWLAIAGVNVLLNENLFGWFVKERLEASGMEAEHLRDSVRLRPKKLGRDLFLTRIADTILLSTEGLQLARIQKSVALDGLPAEPSERYRKLMPGYEDRASEVTLLARRAAVERGLGLEQRLRELWGPETLDLAECSVPRLGGDDVLAHLDVGEGLGLGLGGAKGVDGPGDLAPLLQPFSRERLREMVTTLGGVMPKDAFGLVYLEARMGVLLRVLLARPDILSATERQQLDQFASETKAFGSREALFEALDTVAGGRVAIVFFRQPREPLVNAAEAGYVLVAPLKDEQRFREIMADLEGQVRRTQGHGPLKDLVHRKAGEVEIWEPSIVGLDDPRVTKPALGIVRGHILLTNFGPFLDALPAAMENRSGAMAANEGLLRALAYAPSDLRLAGLVDLAAIYPYFEQSSQGWASGRTKVTNQVQARWRQAFGQSAQSQGLAPGSPKYQAAEDDYVAQRMEKLQTVERPRIAKEIKDHLDWFRGLFANLGIFVENRAGGVSFLLRVDVNP